jgi:hypothetical protein
MTASGAGGVKSDRRRVSAGNRLKCAVKLSDRMPLTVVVPGGESGPIRD